MLRYLRSSSSGNDRRMSEMDTAILRSLDRLVGQLIQSTWQDLSATMGIETEPLDFSGVHSLGATRLVPYLDRLGVILLFGPLPEVRILHLGGCRTTMRAQLNSALIPSPDWSWGWRGDPESYPVPSFAACVAMDENLLLIPALRSLLAQYLVPLQSVQEGPGKQTGFS
ncbi:MAG: hypothetical protein PVJ04_05000 [Gemmatimonadota bacterium]|jgi:hypothetical protein